MNDESASDFPLFRYLSLLYKHKRHRWHVESAVRCFLFRNRNMKYMIMVIWHIDRNRKDQDQTARSFLLVTASSQHEGSVNKHSSVFNLGVTGHSFALS